MNKSTRRLRASNDATGECAPVALGGEVVHEPGLPLPWVAYPPHYGTFHTFAPTPEGPWSLCACAKPAVVNLVEIYDAEAEHRGAPNSEQIGLPEEHLPLSDPWNHTESSDVWVEAACHRCNIVTPLLRWAHEMYETQFNQFHGWYTAQAMARAGFRKDGRTHSSAAPPDLVRLRAAAEPWSTLPADFDWPIPVYRGSRPDGTPILASEEELAAELSRRERIRAALPKPDAEARRRWRRLFEDEARTEFGYRRVGEGFVAESQLAAIVAEILGPGDELFRHHRPEWLGGLELDIWVPSLRLGIEYQGQQHYMPIAAWGGEPALSALQARDQRKRNLCVERGVELMEVAYTEPLTRSHIEHRMMDCQAVRTTRVRK